MRAAISLLLAGSAALCFGCGGRRSESPAAAATPVRSAVAAVATPAAAPGFTPDLGELMTLQQMRHAKLWWAGEAGNWPLAGYELDELQEGFDAVVRYHPTHKDAPVPIRDAVPTIMDEPIAKTRQAIEKKDRRLFSASYTLLTEGCNACHQATNFGFNVVKKPAVNTFSNQSFAPAASLDK